MNFLKRNKKEIIILLLIIILAVILRLINLGVEPYWGDEVLSLDIVKHYQNDVSGMLTYLQTVEVHPPLYYLMLYGWTKIFGWGEFGVRLLSLFFGLAVIVLTYFLSRHLFKKKVALLTAFLMAILPFQIEFSQEARPYIIFCFFALLASLAVWRYLTTEKNWWLVLYGVATLFGLFLHYSYVFLAVALAGYWLINIFYKSNRKQLKKSFFCWFGVQLAIFVVYFWQLIAVLYKLLLSKYLLFNAWRNVPTTRELSSLENIFNQLIWLNKNTVITKMELLGVVLFKVVLLVLLVWLLVNNFDKNFKKLFGNKKKELFFVMWLAVGPVLLFMFSPHGVEYAPIYARHVISSSVFIVLLLAYLFNLFDCKKKLLLIVLLLASLLNSMVLIINDDSLWDFQHGLKATAEFINGAYNEGDLVVVLNTGMRSDVNHFLNEEILALSLYPLDLMNYEYDVMSTRETLGLMENESQLRTVADDYRDTYRIGRKLNYFIKKYQPQGIWLVLNHEAEIEKNWLRSWGWQQTVESFGPMQPVVFFRKSKH